LRIGIAHRGDPLHCTENTMGSFQSAAAHGADMLELDVKRTLDGQAAIVHDDTLDRIWGLSRSVENLRRAEVEVLGTGAEEMEADAKRLGTGSGVMGMGAKAPSAGMDRIPFLEDVFGDNALSTLDVMVDFGPDASAMVIVSVLREHPEWLSRALVTSGNVRALQYVRRELPSARIALTWTRMRFPSKRLLDTLQIDYLNPFYRLLLVDVSLRDKRRTPYRLLSRSIRWTGAGAGGAVVTPHGTAWPLRRGAAIARAHALGLGVSCWTVDCEQDMRTLLELGADAIITNRIAAFVTVRTQWQRGDRMINGQPCSPACGGSDPAPVTDAEQEKGGGYA